LTIPVFGYGVGIGGAGGAGVRQTSGMAKQVPPPLVDAGKIATIVKFSLEKITDNDED
jgi:hypothetical protein